MTTYIVTFEVNDDFKKDQIKEKLKQYSGYCPNSRQLLGYYLGSKCSSDSRFFE